MTAAGEVGAEGNRQRSSSALLTGQLCSSHTRWLHGVGVGCGRGMVGCWGVGERGEFYKRIKINGKGQRRERMKEVSMQITCKVTTERERKRVDKSESRQAETESLPLPVAVDVRGAEGEAVVQQRGVDHGTVLSPLQQIAQVAQVPVAATHTVACAVLVHDKHLTRAEPTLEVRETHR